MALDFTGFDAIPEHTCGALERYVEFVLVTNHSDEMGLLFRSNPV